MRDAIAAPAGNASGTTHTTPAWPFWLLVLFFFVEYGRIHDYIPFLSVLRPGLVLTVLLVLAWLSYGDRTIFRETLIRQYLAFAFLAFASILYAVNTFAPFEVGKTLSMYFAAGVLPATTFVRSPDRITLFFRLWVLIHAFKAVVATLSQGQGGSSFMLDENDLALALNMAIPYAYFSMFSRRAGKGERLFSAVALALLVAGVVATMSRGGFLGLIAVAFGVVLLSRSKVRNLLLIAVAAGVAYGFVPQEYKADVRTISNSDDPTRNDRLYSWRRGWEMFLDYPVLGVGAGNYPWRVVEYELRSSEYDPETMRLHGGRVAHSLYFTLIPEWGVVGTALFFVMVWTLWKRLRRAATYAQRRSVQDLEYGDLALLAKAMMASLFGFFVSGAFISVLYYPHIWYLVGFTIALDRIVGPDVEPRSSRPCDRGALGPVRGNGSAGATVSSPPD